MAFGAPGAGTSAPIMAAWPTNGRAWSRCVARCSGEDAWEACIHLAAGTAATSGAAPASSVFLDKRLGMAKAYIRTMTQTPFSESIQDYLRVVYKLEAEGGI